MAQIKFQKISTPTLEQVSDFEDKTSRGERGFSSTGLSKKCKFVNKYISNYAPPNLRWWQRDGLLTYIDQLKYTDFTSHPDYYINKEAEVINFDMIHRRYRANKQCNSDRYYQTVFASDLKKMS